MTAWLGGSLPSVLRNSPDTLWRCRRPTPRGNPSRNCKYYLSCDHAALSLLTWKPGGLESHPSVCREKSLDGAPITNCGDVRVVAFWVSLTFFILF